MNDMFSVRDRVVAVTGASAGIGRALAVAFAERGAKVVAVARRQNALDALLAEAKGEMAAVIADLGALDALAETAQRISEPFGGPDIVINAAGLNPRRPADEQELESWRATLDINLSAPFFLAQALTSAMQQRGWGRVINFASLQSGRAFPNGIAYGASKGGVAQLTRAMAEAWSSTGVTANAIAPGFFPTELTQAVFGDPERAARNAAQTCIGRNGVLDDLIGPAMFLASPASDFVTGQILYVDGGFTAK